MNRLRIKEPIWISRSIGISERWIISDELYINILYKDQYGNKIYPANYKIKTEKILKYPIKYCGKIKLYIVPIKDLTIIKDK